MAKRHTTLKLLFSDIADKIREKTGGTDKIVADNFPDAISNIPIDGIDTSDATALASDIAQGKTAYVNGEKVTGTVKEAAIIKKYNPTVDETIVVTTGSDPSVEPDTKSGTYIRFSSQIEESYGKAVVSPGTELNQLANVSKFGDASASDVVSGKTFTSAAGLKVTGTHVCDGIDTSDATAAADDIAKGKTAYVNGIKVTGSIKEVPSIVKYDPVVAETLVVSDSSGSASNPGKEGIYIGITSHIEESDGKNIVSPGTTLEHVVDPAEFGNATAADVVAGKTFTSAAGLKVTGTHVCDGGLDTSDATATAGDILSGKTAYVNGSKVTGSIAAKSASDITASGKTVTVPAGYYASSANKSVETATQATPSISVDTSGKITATSEQSAGYVIAGTKSATKQLSTQAAQTITPGTEDKTIAAGQYLSGAQTIKGDANLLASNIKSGVSIFGVSGSYSGSSGGGSLTSKSGTITTSSFDTGFSEIVAIIIDKVSENSTGMTMASFIPIIGKGTISGCSSYNTYMKQYASKISSNSCNVEGGTFNWVDTNATYAFKEGDSYYWYAIGYE